MKVREGDLVKQAKSINKIWNLPCHEDTIGLVVETYEDSDGIPYAKISWPEPLLGPPAWHPVDGLRLIDG